jgi:hypothetical protein
MTNENISSGGTAPKIANNHIVALYESASGKIRHLHCVTVFEGGASVSENQAVTDAQKAAAKFGHNVKDLKVKTSTDRAHAIRPHRIDVSTGNFVPLTVKPFTRKG